MVNLYIICFLIIASLIGGYFLFSKIILKNSFKKISFVKWYVRIIAIVSLLLLGAAYFVVPGAMMPKANSNNMAFEGGCHFLEGIPYGDNKLANFFAWFQIFIYYPTMVGTILVYFYRFRVGYFLNKYVFTPLLILNSFLLFNLVNAVCGNSNFNYQSILLVCEVAFVSALALINFILEYKTEVSFKGKEVLHGLLLFLFALIMFIPSYSLATLLPPDLIFFGNIIYSLHVYDFSFLHRLVIYGVVLIPVIIYFCFRETSLEERKFVLILVSIAGILSFTLTHGFFNIFSLEGISSPVGTVYVYVRELPLHLCHTALYVVPLTIILKRKKLFYFTYFINVFGAICAIFMPNTGEHLHPYDPYVWVYWMNHLLAFMMPLLCVALKLFERPKFKQMGYSLLFFALYFVLIVFCNAWLSNYVNGYNPDVAGSGTDYLFINGTFILDKLSESAKKFFISNKWAWTWGNLKFQIYPLYQLVFFLVYVVVAFLMWFVYVLFFKVGDAHYDIYCRLKVAKLENITFKQINKKGEDIMDEQNHKPELEYIHFSKRYGTSKILSANDVNLHVNGGEIFGFLGPNGAGKSTTIKTTIGIQPITEGQILVCGYDIKTQTVKAKEQIGYVPDHYALYEKLTGREYINYIADLYHVNKQDRDSRIDYYVQLLELTQAFDNRMQTYSHGMKQKITIMAALIHNPKVWILDEPLTGLDPQSIYQVKQCMINHAAKGNIVFFSSHIIDVVEKLCTRIAIIRKGHIVYESDMKTLEKDHPEGLEEFYMKTISEVEG